MLKQPLRDRVRRMIYKNVQEYDTENLSKSALVVAPHPDDETLGCGGTLVKKIRAGANVHVVVMSDGTNSHPGLLPRQQLKAIRQEEVVAACEILGVAEENVIFLDFRDGQLFQAKERAIDKMAALLDALAPDEIFVPYRHDRHPDHIATTQITYAAQKKIGEPPIDFYEYPIWLWRHWPWVSIYSAKWRLSRSIVRDSLYLRFGLHMRDTFRRGVYIDDVLAIKRRALAQHRSQVTQFFTDRAWPNLQDISDGEWVDCFFQQYEIFHRRVPTDIAAP